jgi:hypothetical protein
MMSRESVSQRLRDLLEQIQANKADQVDAHWSLLSEDLNRLLQPIRDRSKTGTRSAPPPIYPAIEMGFGIERVTEVKSLVSEGVSFFDNRQPEAAAKNIQKAIQRWEAN